MSALSEERTKQCRRGNDPPAPMRLALEEAASGNRGSFLIKTEIREKVPSIGRKDVRTARIETDDELLAFSSLRAGIVRRSVSDSLFRSNDVVHAIAVKVAWRKIILEGALRRSPKRKNRGMSGRCDGASIRLEFHEAMPWENHSAPAMASARGSDYAAPPASGRHGLAGVDPT